MLKNTKRFQEIEKKFIEEQGLPFSKILQEEEIRKTINSTGVKYRKRKISPIILIWSMLSQVLDGDSSYRKAAGRLVAFFAVKSTIISLCRTTLCKAKKRLPLKVLSSLTKQIASRENLQGIDQHLWCNRRVKIYDGSTVLMADTPENQKIFPQWVTSKPGLGFPIARWCVMFCLSSGMVLESYIEPMKISERVMFRRFFEQLDPNDVVLGDRGCCSYADVIFILRTQADCVFRLKKHNRITYLHRTTLGDNDDLVVWKKPKYDKRGSLSKSEHQMLPDCIVMRELEYTVSTPGFRTKTVALVTSLLDHELYTKESLASLFLMRWQVEVNIRHIKTTLKMKMLKSKSPDFACKDIWTHLLAYNLIRRVIWHAALLYGSPPLRISFKGSIDHINVFLFQISCSEKKLWLLNLLFFTISKDLIPLQPNRFYERCIKLAKRSYPYIRRTREEYRNSIISQYLNA